MSSHEIAVLLHQYGYGVVFAAVALQAVGLPLPGTTVLVAAAVYAASSHGLAIGGVIAVGALGALVGTCAGFALGHWRGEQVLGAIGRRVRQSPERVAVLRDEFAAHAASWLFIGRFVTGLRNVTGLLAGASGMPLASFLPVSAAAAAAWALVEGVGYYLFGGALAGAETWVQVVLVGVGIAWLVLSITILRRRAMGRIHGATPP